MKTVIDKIKERVKELYFQSEKDMGLSEDPIELYSSGGRYDAYDNVLDIIDEEERKSSWIPCEKGIPDDSGDPVMVTTISGNLLIAIFEPEEGLWWASDYDGAIYDVIAWMPLPEPYKAEKGE